MILAVEDVVSEAVARALILYTKVAEFLDLSGWLERDTSRLGRKV